MRVSEANCHPFRNGRFLWMHNGTIAGFSSIKRRLRQSLPDEIYHAVEGTTDSEHAFAVFLDILGEKVENTSAGDIAGGLVKTIWKLEEWGRETGVSLPSIYNFAVTDGQNLAAVRYVSDPKIEPISLYFSKRGRYQCDNGRSEIVDCSEDERGIIIASERLTEQREDWTRVAPNHVVMIDSQLDVKVHLMPDV